MTQQDTSHDSPAGDGPDTPTVPAEPAADGDSSLAATTSPAATVARAAPGKPDGEVDTRA